MSLTIPEAEPHTAAIVQRLRDSVGIAGPDQVGVGAATGAGLTSPYVVVYADLGNLDGPLGDRHADLDQTLIIHGVGTGPEQAQWASDKARVALLSVPVSVPDRAPLYLCHDSSQPARRDEGVQPPLFYAVDTYTFATTPA